MQFFEKNENTSVTESSKEINSRFVIEVFLIILLVVIFLKSFVVEFFKVESASMEPILYKNDIVIVSRLAYFFGFPAKFPLLGTNFSTKLRLNYSKPKLGDIIVFDADLAGIEAAESHLIKRVTGIPGDTVLIRRNSNAEINYNLKKNSIVNFGNEFVIPKAGAIREINVNNIKYYNSILINEGKSGLAVIDSIRNNPFYISNYKISNNYYFVSGDNFSISLDSRSFGLISDKTVIGRAVLIFSTENKLKLVR